MRFKPEHLGMLVRPRILTTANILVSSSMLPSPTFLKIRLAHHNKNTYIDPAWLFGEPLDKLFGLMKLGDTSADKSSAYVAQIVSYLVKVGSSSIVVDKTNIQETLKKAKNRLGPRTNLKVISVGVKFYHGFKEDQEGVLAPTNELVIKTKDGQEVTWFYKPWDLVPITEIIKYESVSKGNLILFKQTNGLVVKKKRLNKPKYYSTSSWSCYAITLLNHTADGFTRFLPNRQFKVARSSDAVTYKDE